jgi:hypothetical protein
MDRLKDPFEARSEHPYKSGLATRFEEFERKGCVSCWTVDTEESELMWYAYAPNYGTAIRSTVGDLRGSFNAEKDTIKFGRVEYGTDWSKGPPETYAFLKRRRFRREEEFRAFLPYEYQYRDGTIVEPTYDGMLVSVDLRALMKEVWVSPYSPPWFRGVVERELESYGLKEVQVLRRAET